MQDKRMMDSTKLLWHMDRVIDHFDNGIRVPPIHIDMGIAKFCNVACVFCYGLYQNMQNVLIKRDALLNAVSDAADIGVKSIGFIGDGEPTCNPACYEALELGKSKGLSMAISTNGVLLNEKTIHSILSSCDWMRFCLSAGTKDGYKKIHGKDYFDIVARNVAKAVETKEKTGYQCDIGLQAVFVPTIMQQEMIEESKFAVRSGVDYLVIKQCSLPDSGESGMSTFDVNAYDSMEIENTLSKCEIMSNEKTQIIAKKQTMKMKGIKSYQGCPSIPLISEISGNGDWYPCGYMFGGKPEFDKYKFGNVQDQRLSDIFHSERYWDIIDEMKNNFNVQKMCKGCCRQDHCNEFCYNYLQKPKGVNFI